MHPPPDSKGTKTKEGWDRAEEEVRRKRAIGDAGLRGGEASGELDASAKDVASGLLCTVGERTSCVGRR
jgi:hypothetical protein